MLLDGQNYSGTATSSDHFMVITKLMFCIPNNSSKQQNTPAELCNRRYHVMSLVSKKELQVMYKVRLAEKLAPIVDHLEDGGESVEELWSTLKGTIHEVTMETIAERPVIQLPEKCT